MSTAASLRLFNSVISCEFNSQGPYLDDKLGIVVPTGAMDRLGEIKAHFSDKLSGKSLNQTFYDSWKKVKDTPLLDRFRDQLTHYFSTYGLMNMGLDSPDFIYLPPKDQDIPEDLRIKVIKAVSKEELRDACLKMLSSGIALKQDTIMDILSVLDDCGYKFTVKEDIKNREAMVIIADKKGVLPNNPDDLFRYVFYKATGGQSLVIKNKAMEQLIGNTKFDLSKIKLGKKRLLCLAESFNRYKPLWMAIKGANPKNRTLVNKLSKLSKTHHKPLPTNPIMGVTTNKYDGLSSRLKGYTFFQLVRAVNSALVYNSTDARMYRIRNGKLYVDRSAKTNINLNVIELLLGEMNRRIGKKKVYIPEHVNYALPTSEKMFSGNIPKRTVFTLPDGEDHVLAGVYWHNEGHYHCDLDVSAVSVDGKTGWNSSWNRGNGEIMYSGDITNAPSGATEYIYCKTAKSPQLINVNSYSAPAEHPFKILLGYGSGVKRGYVIDPNKLVMEVKTKFTGRQHTLGLLSQEKGGLSFALIDSSFGNMNVAGYGTKEQTAVEYIVAELRNCLKIKDLITSCDKDEADVDLSLENLSRDSIMNLFS